MADEEVDWGLDEPVDDWRGNGGIDGGEDDVISLDGMEADPEGSGVASESSHPTSPSSMT